MKNLFNLIFFTLILLTISLRGYATHNRAGEIVYKHISGYKYQITIYTYCYTQTEADRESLELDCGDGTGKITLPRISKSILDNNETLSFSYLCKNVYVGEHTFSGPGTYVLYMEDPNRNDGVLNIPNSVNVVFSIKTTLVINAVTGNNSSPILLNAPMDKAALNKTFVHNPGAYDPDGDSLSYRIATCLQQDGQEIVGYTLPPVTDSIYVNPKTGDFVWERPAKVGTYNVAMWIEEWRNGVKIGQVLRDIQVEVIDTDNHTPIIDKNAYYCVLAGNELDFKVTAHDPDGDQIQMTASGGPFEVENSPATFEVSATWTTNPEGKFDWKTQKEHVKRMPYDVLIKCLDDDEKVPLTAYHSIKISVVAPAPEIVETFSTNSTIKLTWNKGGNKNVTGYKIYRRDRSDDNFSVGVCETGLSSEAGYDLIYEVKNGEDTVYVDSNYGKGLPNGFIYCYRVVAVFADGALSQPSEKKCALLQRGLITFTKASVDYTDEKDGVVQLEWLAPARLDTISIPPPYYYLLYPYPNGVNEKTVELEGVDNTKYTDKGFDTYHSGTFYSIAFANYDAAEQKFNDIGAASTTTTVFIKTACADRKVTITHECDVPWKNDTFVVFRKDPGMTEFDSIGYSLNGTYVDRKGLVNDQTYYYKMKTIGYFSEDGLPEHIENWSQEAPATPVDTIPPCIIFDVKSNCDKAFNSITWRPDTACGLGIAKYILSYSSTLDGSMSVLEEFSPEVNKFDHYPELGMAGCYIVNALDSTGNVSNNSRVCVDYCEYYRLPNVFTPNGDNKNDIFHPYPYQFVDHIEMSITNRWGKEVFNTTDPDINWDGTDKDTGKLVPDGVYFYICTVYEYRLTGLETRDLQGYITVYSQKVEQN
jgi:gliding motility-associated-like protein